MTDNEVPQAPRCHYTDQGVGCDNQPMKNNVFCLVHAEIVAAIDEVPQGKQEGRISQDSATPTAGTNQADNLSEVA